MGYLLNYNFFLVFRLGAAHGGNSVQILSCCFRRNKCSLSRDEFNRTEHLFWAKGQTLGLLLVTTITVSKVSGKTILYSVTAVKSSS